jgi:glycerol uptake facilitator-like aquaporin
MALLVVSVWSWEVSCAHFNPAVTIGAIVQSSIEKGEPIQKLMQGGVIIVTQFCGGLFGIFLV